MGNRVLTSTNSTISIVTTTGGYCNIDVASITSNQVSDLATYFGTIATAFGANVVSVGNSSINAVTNSTSLTFTNSTVSSSIGLGTSSFGNSTANSTTNATAESFANTSGSNITTPIYTTISNSTVYSNTTIGGETFGNSSINNVSNSSSVVISNSTVNFAAAIGSLSVGNSTVNGTINTSVLALGTMNSTTNGVTVGTTGISFGNSSVNVTINSTSFAFNTAGVSVIRPSSSVLLANNALTANSVAAQNVFPSGQRTVTLAANTTYLVDALYMINNSMWLGNAAIQTSFNNSVAIGTMFYTAMSAVSNNDVANVSYGITTSMFAISQAATTVTNFSTNATPNGTVTIKISGSLVTAGAVGITPQVTYTAVSNSTPSILIGSYVSFTPVTNSSIAVVGSWA